NAGCAQLVSQRQTSHPWCAMGAPILKVEIGVGQRNDVNTGVSHLGNERCGLILVAQRQRATVARNNATFEAGAQNALCDQLKTIGLRIKRFINMEIDFQAEFGCMGKKLIQVSRCSTSWRNECAENPPKFRNLLAALGKIIVLDALKSHQR